MQKIEIVITTDAGDTRVIASTDCIHSTGRCAVYSTNTSAHLDARRAMTAGEQMAVSRLCLQAATRMLAIDPTDRAGIAAVSAYHAAEPSSPAAPVHAMNEPPTGDTVMESDIHGPA